MEEIKETFQCLISASEHNNIQMYSRLFIFPELYRI